MNAGLIIFERSKNDDMTKHHNFALTVESLPVLRPFLGPKRCFELPKDDVIKLLTNRRLFCHEISNPNQRRAIEKLFVGYVVLVLKLLPTTTRSEQKKRRNNKKANTSLTPLDITILCRNGQKSLTLCGDKFDVWALKFFLE
jgi:hypothetical protein